MKRFLGSKLVLSLTALIMIAAAVAIPLSGNVIGTHAAGKTTTSSRHETPGPRYRLVTSGSANQNSAITPLCPPAPASCDLSWNGGTVQEQPVDYAIFWGKSWSTSKGLNADGTIPLNYLKDVGGSNYANILSQYYDSNSHIDKHITFGGMWIDPTNPPTDKSCTSKTIEDSKIHDEVLKAISANSANHWPQGNINATYFVYTPSGYSVHLDVCSHTANGDVCGYHNIFSNIPIIGTKDVYAAIIFPANLCMVPSLQKGENVNGETLANVTAHEQFEAATDPDTVTGWQNGAGGAGEIGDICNFEVGNSFTTLNNSGSFEVQTEYSDVTHNCVNSYTPGNIWLTGHDPDFHCTFQSAQCNYLKVAVTVVRAFSPLPLLVLDHGNEVQTALGNAFQASLNMQVVDPRSGFASVALVDSSGKPLYSAIIVASDITCGGCDNNDDVGITPDSDAINARAADIAQFFSAGGGILGLAGADNPDRYYQFLPTPFVVTGIGVTYPFQFTALGLTLGLIEGAPGDPNSDDNCCATHNSFSVAFLVPATVPYQVAELDGSGFAETLYFLGH